MNRLGFGKMTFSLDFEEDGLVKMYLVKGKRPYASYNVESGARIRDECAPTLKEAGIEIENETIVLFCNMSNWDPDKRIMTQNSPYYASGGLRRGTAWQVDSELLDSKRLSEKEPTLNDGQYGRISVGKYNSIFVGGVCHELGHALGLPHNRERPDERAMFGTSLMGSGNRTYGDELRGEGRGTFLTLADGLRLASHPLFTSNDKGIDLSPNAKVSDIRIDLALDKKSFVLRGSVTADPIPYAVIGYIDPAGGADYDAFTTTAIPTKKGLFELTCETFDKENQHVLRLVVCQSNGGRINDQVLQIPFGVDKEGVVDMSTFSAALHLTPIVNAVKKRISKRLSSK